MNFSMLMAIRNEQQVVALIQSCDIHLVPGVIGARLIFTLAISPQVTTLREGRTPVLDRIEGDLYLEESPGVRRVIGALHPAPRCMLMELSVSHRNYEMTLDLSHRDLIALADITHGKPQIVLYFELVPILQGARGIQSVECTSLPIPGSKWYETLGSSGLVRYEWFVLRTPPRDHPIFSTFNEALDSLMRAQEAYAKNNVETVGTQCRQGWNTLKSEAAKLHGGKELEALLKPIESHKRRYTAAFKVVQAADSMINHAIHLEGNERTGQSPGELYREEALLVLQTFAATLSYIAEINK